jgi:hypothetical protein
LLWHALRRFRGTVVAYSWAANRHQCSIAAV